MTEPAVTPSEEVAEATSLTLLEKARSGSDAGAWERLVSLYEPLVSRWCRLAGLQEADVADVRQEVFTAVARALPGFQRGQDQGCFRGWLRTITRNKVRDLWQQRGRQEAAGGSAAYERLLEVPSLDGSDRSAPDEETGILYRRALDLISRDFGERTWRAFWRVVIDGQRPRDVAGELNMTAGAVSSAKARVLARLREEFAGLLGEEAEPGDPPRGEHEGVGDER